MSNFTGSESMYLNALKISETLYDPLLLAQINSNLGNLYKDMGDYDRALNHYRTSVELSESMNNQIGLSINYINIGSAYKLKGDYLDSRNYLTKAESILKSTSQNGLKSILYTEFIDLGNLSSDTVMSVVYKERYDEVNILINSVEKQNDLLRTSNLLNLKVLDNEIKQRRTELELARKRNQILWILIVSLLIITVIYTIYSTVQRRLLFELYQTRFQQALINGLPVLPSNNDRSSLSMFRIMRSMKGYFRTSSNDQFQDSDESSAELISESVKEDGLEAYYKALVVYLNQLESFENQQFTLDELAYRIGTNNKYLSLSVKKYSGLNFSDFINSFKVKRCVQVMNQSPNIKSNLKQIQDVGGFKSKATFLRAFKKVTGLTPSQYQKQFQYVNEKVNPN
jgi:AraC-like DNA-binding protein